MPDVVVIIDPGTLTSLSPADGVVPSAAADSTGRSSELVIVAAACGAALALVVGTAAAVWWRHKRFQAACACLESLAVKMRTPSPSPGMRTGDMRRPRVAQLDEFLGSHALSDLDLDIHRGADIDDLVDIEISGAG